MSERGRYLNQSAKILLVDVSSKSTTDLCNSIAGALENYFCIVCSMNGPCRIIFCGIIAVGNHQIEVLLPLQHMKANFQRIKSTLDDLKKIVTRGLSTSDVQSGDDSSIKLAINEAISLFKTQAQGLLVTTGFLSQLEIILFTPHSSGMMPMLCEATKQIDKKIIKRIQVICIISNGTNTDQHPVPVAEYCGTEPVISYSSESMDCPLDICELIETCTVQIDSMSINNLVMSWLHDSNTDQENLHIVFEESDLCIKCDMQERMLSAFCFPFYQNYNLSTDTELKVLTTGSSMTSSGLTNRVCVKFDELHLVIALKVVAHVPLDSICDSLIFGNPLIVRRTSCWKMDWDELERNQQSFQALCYLLHERKLALVTRLSTDLVVEASSATISRSNAYGALGATTQASSSGLQHPFGYFILMPSEKCSLLLKSIVGSDLLLPIEFTRQEQPTANSLNTVSSALAGVKMVKSYNPLLVNTGLHSALMARFGMNQSSVSRGDGVAKMATPATLSYADNASNHSRLHDQEQISMELEPMCASPPGRGLQQSSLKSSKRRLLNLDHRSEFPTGL